MQVEWNANVVRFTDIAPGDCFSTPDGQEIMIKIRKPASQPDIPDAISLQTGEPLKVRPDTHVFAISAKMSASVDHDYLRQRSGLSLQTLTPAQTPPAQRVPTRPAQTQHTQTEIVPPYPSQSGLTMRPN